MNVFLAAVVHGKLVCHLKMCEGGGTNELCHTVIFETANYSEEQDSSHPALGRWTFLAYGTTA